MGRSKREPEHPLSVWQKNLKLRDLIGVCNTYGMFPAIFIRGNGTCDRIFTVMKPGENTAVSSLWAANRKFGLIKDIARGNYLYDQDFYGHVQFISICRGVESPVWEPDSNGHLKKTDKLKPAGLWLEWMSSDYMSRRLMPYPENMLSNFEREHYEILKKRLLK